MENKANGLYMVKLILIINMAYRQQKLWYNVQLDKLNCYFKDANNSERGEGSQWIADSGQPKKTFPSPSLT